MGNQEHEAQWREVWSDSDLGGGHLERLRALVAWGSMEAVAHLSRAGLTGSPSSSRRSGESCRRPMYSSSPRKLMFASRLDQRALRQCRGGLLRCLVNRISRYRGNV